MNNINSQFYEKGFISRPYFQIILKHLFFYVN